MANPRDAVPGGPRKKEGLGGHGIVLVLTFLSMIAAVSVSTALLVYTAYHHNLGDGLFALAFAVLSSRAALSWCLWHHGDQPSAFSHQQDRGGRKPVD